MSDEKFTVALPAMVNNGEHCVEIMVTKTVEEFRKEIERVRSLPHYRGEDDFVMEQIESLLRTKSY